MNRHRLAVLSCRFEFPGAHGRKRLFVETCVQALGDLHVAHSALLGDNHRNHDRAVDLLLPCFFAIFGIGRIDRLAVTPFPTSYTGSEVFSDASCANSAVPPTKSTTAPASTTTVWVTSRRVSLIR